MQNTTRQYAQVSSLPSTVDDRGRFANHEMPIRRKGETTILRPKKALVLVHGFTPVILPSSMSTSHRKEPAPTFWKSACSMVNKVSLMKPKPAPCIRNRRKKPKQIKRCHTEFQQPPDAQNYHVNSLFVDVELVVDRDSLVFQRYRLPHFARTEFRTSSSTALPRHRS